ncbi:MAG: D-aminoacyl-tRNA deacylase [Candidatus Neomarinimicrobiota bacterium]
MIAVLQRVSNARVVVDSTTSGEINQGLLIFLGVCQGDTEEHGEFLTRKISNFRIFNDDAGKMNLSIKDVKGASLVVSQFTLCADWKKGRRPSFVRAAPPSLGKDLYERFVQQLADQGVLVQSGVFGAMMEVNLTNDGPVTFVLDSNDRN